MFIANVVLSVISPAVLPPRVAVHFGLGGTADSWAPGYVNTLFFIGINTFLFLCFYFTPRLAFRFSAEWINLPNKEYWLRTENKSRTIFMFSSFMWKFGTGLFLFLFFVQLLTIRANLSQPVKLDEELFLSGLIFFMVYSVYWCIKLYRNFRFPKEMGNARRPTE